jgi:hypothetical protein
MSIFDPSTILLGLVEKMGITPKQIGEVMALIQRLNAVMSEIDDFKIGAGQMVNHFTARLDAQDAAIARIDSLLTETERKALEHVRD